MMGGKPKPQINIPTYTLSLWKQFGNNTTRKVGKELQKSLLDILDEMSGFINIVMI